MNNYVAAIELYKQLLEKQPNERLQSNLAAATIAYAYDLYDKKDYGQAILYFEDAIELNPKEASAYFGYASANDKMGCYDTALENYRKAVSLAPANLEYNAALSMFTANHKMEEAKKTADNAIVIPEAKKPEKIQLTTTEQTIAYENLVKNGDEAYKKQQYNDALDYYAKAVVYVPQDKITMLKIANIYKLTGNNTKALTFYDRLISMDKDNYDAYFNKGLVLANQKNYDDAIKCFERVIQLSPDYPYAYYSLGMAYEQKGDTDKALEYYYLYSGVEADEKMINTVKQKIKSLEEKG
jgi:tetratricopeptide (TPR) repeat protein